MSNKYDLLMIENLQLQIQIGKDDTMESKNSMAELVIEFNNLKKLRDATVIREKQDVDDFINKMASEAIDAGYTLGDSEKKMDELARKYAEKRKFHRKPRAPKWIRD